MVPLARAFQVVHKRLHAVQTCLVKWLQNIERGKQKCAGAAGRVENRDGRDGLIECPQQFWPLAIADDVLGKLAQVEVVGDQVVDLVHLSGLKLVA
jgi:hypothetical protein